MSNSLSRQLVLIVVISALLLILCFWHRHIEAGDLGSHLYNAWLAQLIEQGRTPGLYTVRPWTNILLDVLLLNFSKMLAKSEQFRNTAHDMPEMICELVRSQVFNFQE